MPLESKINIEIDGSSHRGREEKDAERDAFLRSRGWKVIRIKL
jgi:very-short-patch-repair endonuclease